MATLSFARLSTFLLALVLVTGGAAARAQPRSRAPAVTTTTLEARDAIVRGSSLYAVSADGQTLRAISLDTGAVRFTARLGPSEDAALISDLGAEKLLVQTPHRFVTVDARSGSVVATRDASAPWSYVWRERGACALRSECTFEPIDCRTGTPLGVPLRGAYSHRMPIEDADDSAPHCEAQFDVLGRAGTLSLYLAGALTAPIVTGARPTATPVESSGRREVIAVDDSGMIRWHGPEVGCDACTQYGWGVSPDGSTCWTSEGDGGSSILTAFECATGRVRFSQRVQHASPRRRPALITAWVPGAGLFAAEGERARLFAPANGAVLWSRDSPSDVFVAPEGATFPHGITISEMRALERVDARGATLRTEVAEGRVIRAADDGMLVLATALRGGERGGGDPGPITRFVFERGRTASRVLSNGRPVLTLPGDAVALGEHVMGAQSVLVVCEYRSGRPDRVHVVRVRN